MSYADLQTTARFWKQAAKLKQRVESTIRAYERNAQPIDMILNSFAEQAAARCAALEDTITEVAHGEVWLDRVACVVQEQPGFGRTHLIVIGLIPPLVDFPNPAKLWKWLSLEPPGQERAHDRKATSFLRSIALFRPAQNVMQNRTEPWRSLWDRRRAHTAVTHPEWGENPKAPKMHYLLDAHRYVAKRMWLVLWRAAHDEPLGMP